MTLKDFCKRLIVFEDKKVGGKMRISFAARVRY
jgi:hypothetical protein